MSVASKIKSPFAWFDFKYIIRLPSFTLHWPDVYMSWYAGNKCNFDSLIWLKSRIKIEHASLNSERYGQKVPDTVGLTNWIVKCQHNGDFENFLSDTFDMDRPHRTKIWSGPHIFSICCGPYVIFFVINASCNMHLVRPNYPHLFNMIHSRKQQDVLN